MAGLVVVVVVSIVTVLAPVLAPWDPDLDATHVGAVPPGSVVPDVGSANRVAIGDAPLLGWREVADGTLTLEVLETVATRYRVILDSRGRVRRIEQQPGGVSLRELDLAASGPLVQVLPDESTKPVPTDGSLTARRPAPPAVAALAIDRVLNLRPATTEVSVRWEASVVDGVVTGLTRNGEATDATAITAGGEAGVEAADVLRGSAVASYAWNGEAMTRNHLLGTDRNGRDFLSRLLYSGQVSLLVGVVATLVSLVIGVVYGAIAGYLGGRTDRVMMGAVDVLYALPFMFLVIILLATFGRHIVILFAALGAVQWLTMSRIVRGEILSLREREFVAAARLAGAPGSAIMARHLIPNCLGPVIVYTTLTVPIVILEESFLAFLGLQVEFGGRALDSWGSLIQNGVEQNGQAFDHLWLLVWPSAVMAITLLALNVLGDGLRDALDPKLRGRQ